MTACIWHEGFGYRCPDCKLFAAYPLKRFRFNRWVNVAGWALGTVQTFLRPVPHQTRYLDNYR